jgi:MoaA/NifB/PqqE/SkfB family radical SAM enzyme
MAFVEAQEQVRKSPLSRGAERDVAVSCFGNIDRAFVFAHPEKASAGILRVTGWCGADKSAFNGRLRGELVHGAVMDGAFGALINRQDVLAIFPNLNLQCGFDAIFETSRALADGEAIELRFFADGALCHVLQGTVRDPLVAVEARKSALSDLRRKKLDNLILNEAERLAHVSRTRSFPVTGQIDPSFACNLECPHCSSEMIRRDGYSIPILKNDRMNEILDTYGPYLIRIWLSFWGEPLLNRALPAIIKRCKEFEIWTLISSNMSVPLKDEQIDAIVASGLDSIVLSIDGATQATYETYRKKGNLSLVLKNARKFVEAKRRLGSATPYLYWRYLHFPWNGHEIDAAREIAAEIGVDEFDVYPGILTPDQKHSHEMRPEVEELQEIPADLQRYLRGKASDRHSAKHYFGCDYLYQSISVNSNGMVHPCCYVVSPMHSVGFAVDSKESVRNHRVMTSSREMFGKLASESTETVQGYDPCVGCPIMQSTEGHTLTQTPFSEMFEHLLYDRKIAR